MKLNEEFIELSFVFLKATEKGQKIAKTIGVIHKGCPHKFRNFWGSPPPVQASPHFVDHLPPPVHADTRLALFETLQLVNNSH